MTTLKPIELLAQLQHLAANVPAELATNASLRNDIATAARNVFLTLEKPEDVVARILLSQVRPNVLHSKGSLFQGLSPITEAICL